MNNQTFPQMPQGGDGRLREFLDAHGVDPSQLDQHPIYKEGYDDGYSMAQEHHRKLMTAVAKVYNINK